MSPATPERPRAAMRRRVRTFSALGDETRLSLLARLGTGEPLSISRLTHGLGQSRQSITKHLRVLARAGLVRGARRGRERCFALRRDALDDARQWLADLSRQWDVALGRLKRMLEREGAPKA